MKRCFAHLDPFVPITRGGRKTTSRVRGIFGRLTYPVVLALVASSPALAPLPAQGQVSAANAPAGAAESESSGTKIRALARIGLHSGLDRRSAPSYVGVKSNNWCGPKSTPSGSPPTCGAHARTSPALARRPEV
ncbi:MAG: hypothetical protein R3B96_15625 [Pirellulaceae bacterium]